MSVNFADLSRGKYDCQIFGDIEQQIKKLKNDDASAIEKLHREIQVAARLALARSFLSKEDGLEQRKGLLQKITAAPVLQKDPVCNTLLEQCKKRILKIETQAEVDRELAGSCFPKARRQDPEYRRLFQECQKRILKREAQNKARQELARSFLSNDGVEGRELLIGRLERDPVLIEDPAFKNLVQFSKERIEKMARALKKIEDIRGDTKDWNENDSLEEWEARKEKYGEDKAGKQVFIERVLEIYGKHPKKWERIGSILGHSAWTIGFDFSKFEKVLSFKKEIGQSMNNMFQFFAERLLFIHLRNSDKSFDWSQYFEDIRRLEKTTDLPKTIQSTLEDPNLDLRVKELMIVLMLCFFKKIEVDSGVEKNIIQLLKEAKESLNEYSYFMTFGFREVQINGVSLGELLQDALPQKLFNKETTFEEQTDLYV